MLKIVEKTKLWFALSIIVIVIGLGFTFTKGLNFGIDFSGGTKIVIQYNEGFNKPEADEIVKGIIPGAVTNEAEGNQYERLQTLIVLRYLLFLKGFKKNII